MTVVSVVYHEFKLDISYDGGTEDIWSRGFYGYPPL